MNKHQREYEQAADAEIARWPGVIIMGREIAKHAVLILGFEDKTRKVFYPASPSDAKGSRNHAQDIRRVLLGMGAQRV